MQQVVTLIRPLVNNKNNPIVQFEQYFCELGSVAVDKIELGMLERVHKYIKFADNCRVLDRIGRIHLW